ncbi:hypothetical protein O7599_04415 [Streptomyces sp. WMMC500]|uniref:hypothetical protein n=1 Tax=Streptomyces sp. WMMC500 TaxID=3015154 RepID=UPI00248B7136|nr:hypothetical protein [Streptomyces sp. WMMC500]WBB61804.1 hypothetical protein O7599_04415 [Streptomyces sp. WMMC500]
MATSPGHVAVLGAGPVGLDAALAATDAGLSVTVYEAGAAVGAHVRAWGHVRLFTPWRLNASARMRTHLAGAGRDLPEDAAYPTGTELADHLLGPLAGLPALAGRVRLGHRVAAVARASLLKHEHIGSSTRAAAPFRLLVDGPDGEYEDHAGLVLDCTGTYATPNSLGDGGIAARGERALAHRITRTLPPLTAEPDRWAGTVLLVGAGKSAQTAARGLAELPGTRLEWLVRSPDPDWGEVPDDSLPERQRLVDVSRDLAAGGHERVTVRTGARVTALAPDAGGRVRAAVSTATGPHEIVADHVVALTGYAADSALYRQLQVHECYATGAPMNVSAALLGSAGGDCLAQPAVGLETLRNPEPGFYILGAKSYGRLNTFLLRGGYAQVDEVAAAWA